MPDDLTPEYLKTIGISPWKPEPDIRVHQALGKLAEEGGELMSIVARCLIQGLDQVDPGTHKHNAEVLRNEMSDVVAAIHFVTRQSGITIDQDRVDRKLHGYGVWIELIDPPPQPEPMKIEVGLDWKNGEARSSLGDLYQIHQMSENVWSTYLNGTAFFGWTPNEAEAKAEAETHFRGRLFTRETVAVDTRPKDCRFRLQDEGKAFPRSGCSACGKTITTGLGKECTRGHKNT